MENKFFYQMVHGERFFFEDNEYMVVEGPADRETKYAVKIDNSRLTYFAPSETGLTVEQEISELAARLIEKHTQAEEFKTSRAGLKNILGKHGWWTEVAGVFDIEPRQVGKTSALREYISFLKEVYPDTGVLLATPWSGMREQWSPDSVDFHLTQNQLLPMGLLYNRIHLVMDEFTFFDSTYWDMLLNNDWASVTGISSLGSI